MKKIIVYGSKDFARVIKHLVIQCGHIFIGFVDDYNIGEDIIGTYEFAKQEYPASNYEYVIAIGYNDLKARWSIFQKVIGDGFSVATLVHPQSNMDPSTHLGIGNMIMRGVTIDVNVEIGSLVVLWPGTVVNHDVTILNNNFISPNATICGFVNIGNNCFIGAGSVIVNNMSISNDAFIKAGSVYFNK